MFWLSLKSSQCQCSQGSKDMYSNNVSYADVSTTLISVISTHAPSVNTSSQILFALCVLLITTVFIIKVSFHWYITYFSLYANIYCNQFGYHKLWKSTTYDFCWIPSRQMIFHYVTTYFVHAELVLNFFSLSQWCHHVFI